MVGLLLAAALQDPLDVLRGPDAQTAMRELVRRGEEVRAPIEAALPTLDEPARSRAEMVLALLDWRPRWPTYTLDLPAGRLGDAVIALQERGMPVQITLDETRAAFREVAPLSFRDASAVEIADALASAGDLCPLPSIQQILLSPPSEGARPPFRVGPYSVGWASASGSWLPLFADLGDAEWCHPREVETITLVASDGRTWSSRGATYSDPLMPRSGWEPACGPWRGEGAAFSFAGMPRDFDRVTYRGWITIEYGEVVERVRLPNLVGSEARLGDWVVRIEEVATAVGDVDRGVAIDSGGEPAHAHAAVVGPYGRWYAVRRRGLDDGRSLLSHGGGFVNPDVPSEWEVVRMGPPRTRRLYFEFPDVDVRD